MSQPQVFSPKDPAEIVPLAWDFAALLGVSETIETCTWIITDPAELSAEFANMLPDGPAIDTTFVRQRIANGTDGVSYKFRISIHTSANNDYTEKPTMLVTSE